MSLVYRLGTDHIENTASIGSSIFACVYVAAEACLLFCSLTTAVSAGSTILALRRHNTTYKNFSVSIARL
jgi:hypothetical protein